MKVSLRRCESYETEVLLRALQSLLEPLGGIEALSSRVCAYW